MNFWAYVECHCFFSDFMMFFSYMQKLMWCVVFLGVGTSVCVCICCSSCRTGCLVKVTVIFRRQHNCKNQKGVAGEWILCLLGCSFYWWCLCQTERTLVRVRLDTMQRVALEVIILLLLLSFNCLLVGRVVLSDRIRWIVFVSLHSHFSLFVSVRLFNEIFS